KSYFGYQVRGGVAWAGFKGSAMPPPEAVKAGKVAALTDEDRRTIFRWIDLGCPIDHDFDPKQPERRGKGWMLDDQRPTLTLTFPRPGVNEPLTRILVGMFDYGTGLDMDSFQAVADFPIAGIPAGQNLAKEFRPTSASGLPSGPSPSLRTSPRGAVRAASSGMSPTRTMPGARMPIRVPCG